MRNDAFRIVPLAEEVVRELRARRVDDMGNALTPRRDAGRHQCRSCLRLTEPWEPYYAVSYAPMPGTHAFAERGPIYVHERPCERWSQEDAYPDELPRAAVVLRAYGADDEIADACFVGETPVEEAIGKLLANPAIRYVHARNATYGCFMFRIERAGAPAEPSATPA